MFPLKLAAPAAAWLLLLGTASAIVVPNGNRNNHAVVMAPRETQTAANPTDVWVSVDQSGNPQTVTPVLTTVSGTPTVISGAPYDVTGTVFTTTANAAVTTSTGVPQPVATGAGGGGAFALCHNTAGDFAPFCEPKNNDTIYPGATHYITWDPAYFKDMSNTTLKVVGFYNLNQTDEAFSSSTMSAGWGFFQWPVTADLFTSRGKSAVNITLRIAALPHGAQVNWLAGPTVTVMNSPTPTPTPSPPPTGPALYIGVPTIVGFIALMLVGTCVWNRRHRKIGLSSVMGRGRRGYGVGKSRRQRVLAQGGTNKEQGIRLMEREVGVGGGDAHVYRDEPLGGGGRDFDGLARRDSDALGSLAGTPTTDRHFDLSRPAPGSGRNNIFREEMDRQAREQS